MREGALLAVDYVFLIEDPPTYIRLTERLQKKGISPHTFMGQNWVNIIMFYKVSSTWLQGDTQLCFLEELTHKLSAER